MIEKCNSENKLDVNYLNGIQIKLKALWLMNKATYKIVGLNINKL
jgi:hypothetical protein